LVDDVWRRDFTVNALYYDAVTHQVLDFCNAIEDLRNKQLKLMGDPLTRYQEDPVRLLRAIRFKAKLNFQLESETAKPLMTHGYLIGNVPAARLFDEVLKMFIKGYGKVVLDDLIEYDLLQFLFPQTDKFVKTESGYAGKIMQEAMQNTDKRIAIRKNVSPVFFFAVMLWAPIESLAGEYIETGTAPINAWTQAALEVFSAQQASINIPRRVGIPAQNVVIMQARFSHMHGRRVLWLLQQARFRAAYDLMLLRAQFGLVPKETAEWWTHIQTLNQSEKEALVFKKTSGKKKSRSKKRKRRKPKPVKPE
jgi:poly(A) polymerase